MKAILIHKNNAMDSPGGGEVQLLETAAALNRLGVETEVCASDMAHIRQTQADVYHFFGTVAEFLPLIETLSQKGLPCLVSTIAWYDLAAYWHEPDRLLGRLRAVGRFGTRAALPWLPSWRKRLYQTASMLLPNSEAESRQLVRYFGVPKEKIRVVPNGVDPRFSCRQVNDGENTLPTTNLSRRLEVLAPEFDISKAVLCVGRFEPRKNQLGLIRALQGTEHLLLFIGGPAPGHKAYYQKCQAQASHRTVFLGPLNHDDPVLAEAYAACACLVLPSRFETPGLVALEAALTGTPLVLTERGCTREYFGDLAEYVSPDSAKSIRQAVARAIDRGRQVKLVEQVLSRYTWDQASRATLDAYEEVVSC